MFENWSTIKKLIWLKYTLAAKVKEILYTLSGSSPLSFDKAVAKPMEHLITNIKPVQNLNGYDAPWPGGGGTNKLPIKEEYIVLYKYINNNGEILGNNNNFYVDYYIPVTSNTEYNITITTPISYCSIMEYDENKTFIARNLFNCTASTEFVTETQVFTTSGNTKYVLFGANLDSSRVSLEKVLSYKYQLQTGNFTGFTPYENLCPIQGWKTITAWDDAKYGRNIEWNQYVTDPTTKANMKPLPNGTQIINGHKYLLIFNGSKISEQQSSIMYFYVGRNSGVYATVGVGSYKFYTATVTVTADGTVNDNANSVWGYLAGDCNWDSFNVFDLTRMFGAGNEPTTLDEFTDLFPNDYYPYNAGEHTCVGAVNSEPYRKVPVTFGVLSVNQWDEEWESGTISTSSGQNIEAINQIRSKNYIPVKPNTTYYAVNAQWAFGYDENKNVIEFHVTSTTSNLCSYVANQTFTTPSNCYYMRFYMLSTYGTTYNHNVAINYPATVTTYNPYTDTIYGGTLDLVTGDGTIENIIYEPDSTWNINYEHIESENSDRAVITKYADEGAINRFFMCSHYQTNGSQYPRIIGSTSAPRMWIYFYTGTYANATAFKAFLDEQKAQGTPVQINAPLADPILFHVDGVSVTPLKGKNNVWTDCGDTLSVTYISSDVSSAVGYAKTDEATAV